MTINNQHSKMFVLTLWLCNCSIKLLFVRKKKQLSACGVCNGVLHVVRHSIGKNSAEFTRIQQMF